MERPIQCTLNISIDEQKLNLLSAKLKAGETLAEFIESALQRELASRNKQQKKAEIQAAPAIAKPAKEKPVAPTTLEDTKDNYLLLLTSLASKGLSRPQLNSIPLKFRALLEHEIASGRWFPRAGWKKLHDEFLLHPEPICLEDFIELQHKKKVEAEADFWLKLGQKDLK